MKQNRHLLVGIVTLFIALVTINFLTDRHSFRLDLTEKKEFTLSSSTKTLLEKLDDVVTIRVYFTNNLPPALLPLRRATDDLLDELKHSSGRKLQLEYRDPSTSELEEQKALMLGIVPVQLNVVENDRREVAKIFLGLAVLFGDKQEVIPVVRGTGNLEYDLAQAILKVSTKELPRIGWWGEGDFQGMKELLSRRYELKEVNVSKTMELTPKEYGTLVLASPKEVTEEQLFMIDQFLMAGGKVIALVDRWHVGQGLQLQASETKLTDLLLRYGVTIENHVVLDRSNATASFQGGVVNYILPYGFWPQVRGFASHLPFVAGLESAVFPWTSSLTLAPSETDREISAVATTTSFGISVAADSSQNLAPQSANELLQKTDGKQIPLAALLQGKLTSAFGEGGLNIPKGEKHLTKASEGAKLFVVGSSRFLTDQFLQMFPENALFFENTVDAFALGDVLIGIRSRTGGARPIALLSDAARVVIRGINMIVIPLLILLLGGIISLVRRRRHRALRALYQQ